MHQHVIIHVRKYNDVAHMHLNKKNGIFIATRVWGKFDHLSLT